MNERVSPMQSRIREIKARRESASLPIGDLGGQGQPEQDAAPPADLDAWNVWMVVRGANTADPAAMDSVAVGRSRGLAVPFAWAVAGVLIVAAIVYGVVLGFRAQGDNKHPAGELDALWLCQQTLARYFRDPDSAVIPPVDNFGSDGEFYFAWGGSTRFMRAKNGLGLEVPVSGSCIGNLSTQRITSLSVDGKQILGP